MVIECLAVGGVFQSQRPPVTACAQFHRRYPGFKQRTPPSRQTRSQTNVEGAPNGASCGSSIQITQFLRKESAPRRWLIGGGSPRAPRWRWLRVGLCVFGGDWRSVVLA